MIVLSVGRLIGRSVCHYFLKRQGSHTSAFSIGAFVYYRFELRRE